MALEPDDVAFSNDDEEDWGPDPGLPPGAADVVVQSRAADPYLLRSLARLMVGGAAEGSELFFERLQAWNTNTERLGSGIFHEAPDESRGERLRFAILGLAAKSTDMAQTALVGGAAITKSAYGIFSSLLALFRAAGSCILSHVVTMPWPRAARPYSNAGLTRAGLPNSAAGRWHARRMMRAALR